MWRAALSDLARLSEIARAAYRHGYGGLLSRGQYWEQAGVEPPPGVLAPAADVEGDAAEGGDGVLLLDGDAADGEVEGDAAADRSRPRATPRTSAPRPAPGAADARPGPPSPARRFALLLQDLGPTFVKLGQVLSTRPDILPSDYIAALQNLQDEVSPVPWEQARAVIEGGLGKPVAELFESIDETPIASASIAQVHRARTRSGESVAVKVQRPGIDRTIEADLDLLYLAARFLEATIEETGVYTPVGIVGEFDRAIREELDFRTEASNLRRFHALNDARPYIYLPKLHEALSCRTVITTEFITGVKLSAVINGTAPEGYDRRAIALNILESAFEQGFVDGLFHGDPHPGNIFVLEGNRIALLDFGLVGELSPGMQETIVLLCLAVALRDSDSAARLLYRLGVPDGRVDLGRLQADIQSILDRYLARKLAEIESKALLQELLDLAIRYKIKVPQEYAVLCKAAITLDGVVRGLAPELEVLGVAMPYVKRLLRDRYDPSRSSTGLLRLGLGALSLSQTLPRQLHQILIDLETGKTRILVESRELEAIHRTVRSSVITLSLALIAAAFVVGAFVLVAAAPPVLWGGVPVWALVAVGMALLCFWGALSWAWVTPRIGKIRVSPWLGLLRRERRAKIAETRKK